MGLFDSPEPFKGQDYSTLKKSCLETGQPFEDREFPTTYSSLFFTPDKVILDSRFSHYREEVIPKIVGVSRLQCKG